MKKRFFCLALAVSITLTLLPTTAIGAPLQNNASSATSVNAPFKETGEGWLPFSSGGKVGYKDSTGKVVIAAQFERAQNFSQGIALVKLSGEKWNAYIDTTGKPITPSKYHGASSRTVSDGLCRVYDQNQKAGFIDTTGKEVIPPQYYNANNFSDGLAAVFKFVKETKYGELNKVGYIDTTGKLVIPFTYDDDTSYVRSFFDFHDGLVAFSIYDANADEWPKVGIMDKTGKVIIPATRRADAVYGFPMREGGIITMAYIQETNAAGVPMKGGGYSKYYPTMYDYSGKLIADLTSQGYKQIYAIGNGYAVSQHVEITPSTPQSYWTIFNNKGQIVVDKLAPGNTYALNQSAGYLNGYLYFGGEFFDGTTGAKVSNPGIYNVVYNREYLGAPYRNEPDGKILGVIPNSTDLWFLEKLSNGYAKVRWEGKEVYVWAERIAKLK